MIEFPGRIMKEVAYVQVWCHSSHRITPFLVGRAIVPRLVPVEDVYQIKKKIPRQTHILMNTSPAPALPGIARTFGGLSFVANSSCHVVKVPAPFCCTRLSSAPDQHDQADKGKGT